MQLRAVALFAVLTVTFPGIHSATASGPGQQEKEQPKKQKAKPSEKTSSMSGCVDQQEGRYVLVDDHGLARIANLEADGFPTEGFAKYVGHKVTVRGISSTNGTETHFKVRTVENLSDTCAPQPAQGKH